MIKLPGGKNFRNEQRCTGTQWVENNGQYKSTQFSSDAERKVTK